MKIMFFCWAHEIEVELLYVAKYLAHLPQQFVVAPLVRFEDKQRYTEALQALAESGAYIEVAPIYLKSPNISFFNLLNPNVAVRDFLSISKVIRHTKPDAIVCFYVLHAYPLALLKKFHTFSLSVVAMGTDVNLENSYLQKKARQFIYRNCDLIFARSWKLKEIIEKEHDCNVIVSPSSTDTFFFKPLDSKAELRDKWGIGLDEHVILAVCRLDKNKAVDVLLKAVNTLPDGAVKVLIAGDGDERNALEELASTLGLQEKVTFLGVRNRLELLELYNLSDVFTLSSYAEGLPRVLIEAMACKCIPVATDVGSVSALVISGYNGFTAEPGNPQDLGEKISAVLYASENEVKFMQKNARKSVTEGFDSEKVWRRMVEDISCSLPTKTQVTIITQ
ncbi:MAG: glycosyltransferase [Candidatus Bathyarchaeota archaeon]|nr:glycosyltransferase [Candidatus Bathyarchaeota archaeon]